jgi:hypothetical protein
MAGKTTQFVKHPLPGAQSTGELEKSSVAIG